MSPEHDEPPGGGGGCEAGGDGVGAEKADRHLRRALDDAAPEEELRAIVTVKGTAARGAAEGDEACAPEEAPAPPHPKDFPDRVAYRQAMIEHHGMNPRAQVGAAKDALEKLGLTTRGEGHAGLLIVQGPAQSVAGALELESVERASLDRDVEPRADGQGASAAGQEAGADERVEGDAGGADALGLPPGGSGGSRS